MTPPAGRGFLDTNVLVYSFDVAGHRVKREKARELVNRALDKHDAVISYRVVQEFLNVAIRKPRPRMNQAEAQVYLTRVLMPLCEVFPTESLFSNALSIMDETGWSFYDSLIVGSALSAECRYLLTEDLQHGRTIRGLEIRNPFA
jgi:predicted nucleic acid-binding protein